MVKYILQRAVIFAGAMTLGIIFGRLENQKKQLKMAAFTLDKCNKECQKYFDELIAAEIKFIRYSDSVQKINRIPK